MTAARREETRDRLIAAMRAEPRIFVTRDLATAADGDRLGADLGIDSVGLLYVVMAIEEAFDLAIDDAEEVSEHFTTWGALLDFVEAQRP